MMQMHESDDHAMQFVAEVAFLVKMWFIYREAKIIGSEQGRYKHCIKEAIEVRKVVPPWIETKYNIFLLTFLMILQKKNTQW